MIRFAHRGLSAQAPENTLAAFRLAAQGGYSWIETDVDISADGIPMLLHDTALDRTTNGTGSLYDLTAAQLQELDAGTWFAPEFVGECIPTLAGLVSLMNETGLNANIELKPNEQGAARSYQQIDAVLAELEKLNPEREVLISSFSHLLLAEFKRRAPQYKVAALMTHEMLLPDWCSTLELIGAEAVHPEDRGLTEAHVQLARKAGYDVNVWTVNDAKRAAELESWGVTGIFTDGLPA